MTESFLGTGSFVAGDLQVHPREHEARQQSTSPNLDEIAKNPSLVEEEIQPDTREQSKVRADVEPAPNASVPAEGPALEQTTSPRSSSERQPFEGDKLQQSIELLPFGETRDECLKRIRQDLEILMHELGKITYPLAAHS